MEEKERAVKEYIKELMNITYPNNRLFFDNLFPLKEFFIELEKPLLDFFHENCAINIDWTKISRLDYVEKERIINDFFKYLNINFKMDEVINNGVFNPNTYSVEEGIEKAEIFFKGECGENNNKLFIDVFNSGLITDTVIWAHELAHYRNAQGDYISSSRRLLTESLSFTYEYIFLDFLENIGYIDDAKVMRFAETNNLYFHNYYIYYILQLLLLFDNVGEINKENYFPFFGIDHNYEECINAFYKHIIEKNRTVFSFFEYALSFGISIYLYEEYKKDPSFIEKIEELNAKINELYLEECLSIIGITKYAETGFLDEQNVNNILNAINSFKNKLEGEISMVKASPKTSINKQ